MKRLLSFLLLVSLLLTACGSSEDSNQVTDVEQFIIVDAPMTVDETLEMVLNEGAGYIGKECEWQASKRQYRKTTDSSSTTARASAATRARLPVKVKTKFHWECIARG